jgi:hypothetical protein
MSRFDRSHRGRPVCRGVYISATSAYRGDRHRGDRGSDSRGVRVRAHPASTPISSTRPTCSRRFLVRSSTRARRAPRIAGLPMAVCMVVLMLAPLVTVIGTAGHGSQRLVTRQRHPCVWQPDAVEQPAGRRPRRRATPDARRGGPRRRHSRFQRGRDLSTATSGDGSKRCSTSQRTARKLRNDHHARITSRSTWVP